MTVFDDAGVGLDLIVLELDLATLGAVRRPAGCVEHGMFVVARAVAVSMS